MEDLEKLEENSPTRAKIRSDKKGRPILKGWGVMKHKWTKGHWVKRFVRSNEGRNFDKVYSDFLNKVKKEHIDGEAEQFLIWQFRQCIKNLQPNTYPDCCPWEIDSQGRIVKNKSAYEWQKRVRKIKKEDDNDVVAMRFRKDKMMEYDGLYELFEEKFGKNVVDFINLGNVPIDYYNKHFKHDSTDNWFGTNQTYIYPKNPLDQFINKVIERYNMYRYHDFCREIWGENIMESFFDKIRKKNKTCWN